MLKGIRYQGYLCIDWPKLWTPSLADADKVLPAAAEYLRPLIDEKPVAMTAYKGDKYGPTFDLEKVEA